MYNYVIYKFIYFPFLLSFSILFIGVLVMSTNDKAISTLELIKQRVAEKSQPGNRNDEHHLSLVVEGGGMRGCISAGMLSAITTLEMLHVFDEVVGASAGALALPSFLTGKSVINAPLYATDIANNKFINLLRVLSGNIMNLDYLINDIMVVDRQMDIPAVLNSKIKLSILTTCLKTGNGIVQTNFENKSHLINAMKATATIPGINGNYISLHGKNFIDGCYAEFAPIQTAYCLGATHVLALLNLPEGEFHNTPVSLEARLIQSALDSLDTPVKDTYKSLHKRDNQKLEEIRNLNIPHLAICAVPKDVPHIKVLCKDENMLWVGLEAGFKSMCSLLGKPEQPLPKLWTDLRKN